MTTSTFPPITKRPAERRRAPHRARAHAEGRFSRIALGRCLFHNKKETFFRNSRFLEISRLFTEFHCILMNFNENFNIFKICPAALSASFFSGHYILLYYYSILYILYYIYKNIYLLYISILKIFLAKSFIILCYFYKL